jgi:predicted permease
MARLNTFFCFPCALFGQMTSDLFSTQAFQYQLLTTFRRLVVLAGAGLIKFLTALFFFENKTVQRPHE